ncbi:hypothetical protein CYMTET_55082 [Cymbomonas tetramitiformis]|uniref:E3 ubiquitin-protein ligase CHFR n=1 Tax=Cymbomonas tetramitiformis TaxID=36881 RepID=A0AAE0EN75_9CHLO|nr:hypothetical protein CYMTET_55082 [Cymbomonas tetramitiformis]
MGRESVSVGRHGNNDIILVCERIPLLLSRVHAFIERRVVQGVSRYILKDNKTTNGTYVGQNMIPSGQEQELDDGAVISFGGLTNVSRDGESKRNPYRFVFYEREPTAPQPARVEMVADRAVDGNRTQHNPITGVENDDAGQRDTRLETVQTAQDILHCPICVEMCVDTHILSCGHCFCAKCIFTWYDRPGVRPTCPVCRMAIDVNPVENVALEKLVESVIVPTLSPEEKRDRSERKEACLNVRRGRTCDVRPRPLRMSSRRLNSPAMADALVSFFAGIPSVNRQGGPSAFEVGLAQAAVHANASVRVTGVSRLGRRPPLAAQNPAVTYTSVHRECATCNGHIDRTRQPLCYVERNARGASPVWHHFNCYVSTNHNWAEQGVDISDGLSEDDKSTVERFRADPRRSLEES